VLVLFQGYANFDIIVVLVILLFSIGYIFSLIKEKRNAVYAVPLLLAYLIRVLFLFYDVYSDNPFNLPLIGGELSSDSLRFFNAAINVSRGYEVNYGGAFSKIFGFIFYLTDSSRIWAEFIVMLFSMATFHITTSILDRLDITQTARRNSMYVICLMPNYILLSSTFLRETIITFFLSLSLLYLVKWIQGSGKNISFALAMIFALISSIFHGGMALIIVAYIFAYMIYDPNTGKFVMKQSRLIGTIIFAVVFMILFLEFGSVFFGKLEKLTSASELGISRGAGGSSYARYVGDGTTPLRMLIYSIPRYLYYMFSPFPWQWRGLADIITFIMSSMFYMYIIVSALIFIRKTEKGNRKRNAVILLLISAFLIAFVFSWGVTNTGTATRHRDKFIVLYTIIFALTRHEKLQTDIKHVQRNSNE